MTLKIKLIKTIDKCYKNNKQLSIHYFSKMTNMDSDVIFSGTELLSLKFSVVNFYNDNLLSNIIKILDWKVIE